MTIAQPLDGARIVVARAMDRGESLCRRIVVAGGEAWPLRVIDIQPLEKVNVPGGKPDWLIFTSVAAVEHGLSWLQANVLSTAKVAAIGNTTANTLRAVGIEPDAVPEREESEGLLALSAFEDTAGQTAWLVKGHGGRELLADTLRQRGAIVTVLEVYERRLPAIDIEPLLERWRAQCVDAIVVSSRAGLENLHQLLNAEGRRHLRETQLVMPTPRMLKLALDFDIRPVPVVATGASDDAMMAALSGWWRNRRQDSR